jgi:phage-related protein
MLTNFLNKMKDNLPIIVGIIIGGLAPAFYALAVATWTAMAPLLPFIAAGALLGLIAQAIIKHFGGIQNIMAALQPTFQVMGDIWANYILPVLQSLWDQIANKLWPALVQLWQTVEPILLPVLKVLGIIIGVVIVGAFMLMIEVLKGVIWYITEVANFWSWAIGKIRDAAVGIYNAIKDPFERAFEWIKNAFKEVVNAYLKGVNTVIRGIDKVPGVNIPEIPLLAQGGIVTKPTLAMIGEAGPEAVIPLSKGRSAGVGGDIHIHAGNIIASDSELREFVRRLQTAADEVFQLKGASA